MQQLVHQFTDKFRHGSVAKQVAALPVRRRGARLEVLLITSRETGRWIIPKGWPMDHLIPSNAARLEAFEEAGITGHVRRIPIGFYHYGKLGRDGLSKRCRVEVFLMTVDAVWERWPEAHQRKRKWFSTKKAAARVAEPELKALLLKLK